MTKQKQIEEMARAMCNRSIYEDTCVIDKNPCYYSNCSWKTQAEALYNAGYRKVPDGAVIIPAEERDGEMKAYNEERAELEREIEKLKIQLAQANAGIVNCSGCKLVEINAVRAFAEKLKVKLQNFIYDNEDYDGKLDSGTLYVDVIGIIGKNGEVISLGLIDKLLKEYEVEE